MSSKDEQTHSELPRTIEFKIERFKPGLIDPPQFQTFTVEINAQMTVLDALEQIRLKQDNTLVYRHSCHHSACGTCACIINGVERLACITQVLQLKSDIITLSPLRGFTRIADLAVDMTGFYRDIDPRWRTLKPAEPMAGASSSAIRLEDCIECGACVSSCPVARDHTEFMGPAALAALHNEMVNRPPTESEELLKRAGDPRGEPMCRRALNCSRVCPTQVYPARHIAALRESRP